MERFKDDLHDIGKNLASMMLEGAGFEIVELGTDVPPEKFVAAIKENNAGLLGMSALLTTTMSNMKLVLAALKEAGVRVRVKVMIGARRLPRAMLRRLALMVTGQMLAGL